MTDRHKKLVLVENKDPWEKQPYETAKQFEAFQIYRDGLYERSLASVAKQLQKSEGLIGTWSSKNHWVERADAYLDHLDRQLRLHREGEMARVRMDNAAVAESALQSIGARIVGDDRLPNITAIDWNQLDAGEVLAFWREATKTYRLETGQATDVSQQLNNVSAREALDMVQGMYDTMEPFVPAELKPRMASAVQMFLQRGRAA